MADAVRVVHAEQYDQMAVLHTLYLLLVFFGCVVVITLKATAGEVSSSCVGKKSPYVVQAADRGVDWQLDVVM